MRKYFFINDLAHLYLFSYHVLVCLGLAENKEYFNCTNLLIISDEDDQYNAVQCTSFSNDTLMLPQNIFKDIQILSISAYLYGGLMIDDVNTFKSFSDLMRIELKLRNGLEISESLIKRNELEQLRQELFNLSNLFELSIFYFEFNSKNRQWILPESLQALSVFNSVFEYDLSKCSQLQKLFMLRNELNKMPNVSNPPPPLSDIDLSYNPLREFVVNDVAKYCNLNFLRLEQAEIVYCECVKLMEWIRKNINDVEKFQFKGILECNYVEGQSCSKDMLEEVEQLRNKCFYNTWTIISLIISFIAFIAVVMLACALTIYLFIWIMKLTESGED